MKHEPSLSDQIRSRLYRISLATWLTLALLVALGLVMLFFTDRSYTRILARFARIDSQAVDLSNSLITEMLSTRAYLISGQEQDVTRRDLAHSQVVDTLELLNTALGGGQPVLNPPSLERLTMLHTEYDGVAEQIISLRSAGDEPGARALFDGQSDPLVTEILDSIRSLETELETSTIGASTDYSRNNMLMIVGLGLLLLFVLGASGLVLSRLVDEPLHTLDTFEAAFSEAEQTGVVHPLEIPEKPTSAVRLFTSYNHLTERLMDSSRVSVQYIERLAHEMNSLLATILGYGALLADSGEKAPTGQVEEYGRVIVRQGDRMARLVEDGLLGARIAGNLFNPTPTPTRAESLLQAVIAEAQSTGQRTIRLESTLGTHLVMADPLSLRQELGKVIDNAVRYSPAGAEVTVQAHADLPSGRAVIEVKDCGPGIAAENLPLLFRPFGKIRSETNRQVIGSGMGLYLAREILRAQRGQVTLESQVGQGTTVTIWLPLVS